MEGLWFVFVLVTGATAFRDSQCEVSHEAHLTKDLPFSETLSLDCSERGLAAVPDGEIWVGVRHANLSGNRLRSLNDSFHISNLLSLDLSRNQMKYVGARLFWGARVLKKVSLAHNKISTLSLDTFTQCPDLWYLDLSDNPLLLQDVPFLLAPQLKTLDVSHCKLTTFPDSVLGDNNTLEHLVANGNSITQVRVYSLAQLRRLDLVSNIISNLDQDAFSPASHLYFLTLDGNVFKSPCDEPIVVAPELRVLSVKNSGLDCVSERSFRLLTSLEQLQLDGNGLEAVPNGTLQNLKRLRNLSLRDNHLATLNPAMIDNLVIRKLDLSGNPLSVSGPFLRSQSLKELRLERCDLRVVPGNLLRGMPSLRSLSLASNDLRNLSLKVLPPLHTLDLRTNPLRCGKWINALRTHLSETGGRVLAPCVQQTRTHDSVREEDELIEEEEDGFEAILKSSRGWAPPLACVVSFVVLVFMGHKLVVYLSSKRYYKTNTKDSEWVYGEEMVSITPDSMDCEMVQVSQREKS